MRWQNMQVAQLQGLAILIDTSDDFISRLRLFEVRDTAGEAAGCGPLSRSA